MTVSEHNLDFTRPGPWHSIIESPDGTRQMVSGIVTKVDPPNLIAFTWAWHEGGPGGPRGSETQVTIEISAIDETQARLVLSHYDLGTESARVGHTKGWLSILDNLERGLA